MLLPMSQPPYARICEPENRAFSRRPIVRAYARLLNCAVKIMHVRACAPQIEEHPISALLSVPNTTATEARQNLLSSGSTCVAGDIPACGRCVGALRSVQPLKSDLKVSRPRFSVSFPTPSIGLCFGVKALRPARDGVTLLCRFPLKVSPNKASLALGSRTHSLSVAPTEGARKGDTKCSARIASH